MSENCETRKKPKTFKELMHSSYFWKPALAIAVGGVLGFLYYYYVGCASGSCSITSSPISSIIFGGVFGYFVVNRPCSSC